jgi:hypothetical protein
VKIVTGLEGAYVPHIGRDITYTSVQKKLEIIIETIHTIPENDTKEKK